jgi:phosphoglycerate-specific signal transduction histidine kinase
MNDWVILAGLFIAALIGAALEHARLKENYEFRMDHLHTRYIEQIQRNAKLADTACKWKDKCEELITADRVLHELEAEVTAEEAAPDMFQFAAGQDPRD